MLATEPERTGATTLGHALGLDGTTLNLNRMTTATCGRCGQPPRLYSHETPKGITVNIWIPRKHTCKGVGQ